MQASTVGAILLVKLHEQASREFALAADSFTIGRKPDNHLVIDDPAVSSRHARINKIHAVHFIEDLKSTNGTYVNDKRVERHQLRDTDVITIGRHRLIFRDATAAPVMPAGTTEGLDQTMVLPRRAAQPDTDPSPAGLRVLSGKTDRQQYVLAKQVTRVGANAEASVRLTGWFAPDAAAVISRREKRYSISATRNGKPVLVNGHPVNGEQTLRDADRIQVAGVTLLFQEDSKGTHSPE
jgi:pSer/pThr/pTyr-binding forkhead associated (FHA) protein